ncbi:hypothetical protein EHS39_23655 [Ensifer sp. MPMI2T]|nr:hypothetical protein EHS39_23655 [Ensifer sp. MPMI2T]
MQIIHRARKSFRLMAVYKKVIRWNEGCIWDSDEELAAEAGRCDKKTMSREVAMHRKLGIIALEHGWRKVDGKMLRTRIIRLAIPLNLPPEIVIRDLRCLPNHMDTRGPSGDCNHMDTRGPNHVDTRGPITIEAIEEGACRK